MKNGEWITRVTAYSDGGNVYYDYEVKTTWERGFAGLSSFDVQLSYVKAEYNTKYDDQLTEWKSRIRTWISELRAIQSVRGIRKADLSALHQEIILMLQGDS